MVTSSSARTRWARSARLLACVVASAAALAPHGAPATAQSLRLRALANGVIVPLSGVVIQNGTVMTPYQGLFQPLGIRAVWNARDRSLHLWGPAGDEMVLRADDPYVTVNGERRPVPIPLVAVFDRVLIPLQFVFETLGDAVAFDPGKGVVFISPQITGVSWRATRTGLEVTVDGTGPLRAVSTSLHSPERVVLDFPDAVPKSPEQSVDVHEGPLTTIRMSRYRSGTRIVLDLSADVEYQVLSAGRDRRLRVALAGLPASPEPAPGSAYQPSAEKIADISYEHVEGGGRVLIAANDAVHATPRVLKDPDRIVLDIPDAVFLPVKKALDVDDGLVVQVRAAQFHRNPNIVRVVIELARPSAYGLRAGAQPGQLLVDLGSAAADRQPPAGGQGRTLVVAVDAGHGGSDPGAIGPSGLQEKDVSLAVALDLRRLLGQQHIDVVMIRDADVFVPLEDRAQIAQRGGATLFVSIHANASTDSNANGSQTFYANPLSRPLAQTVLDEISRAAGLTPRGVSQAAFKVLVDTDAIPSTLVELAFITNPREEQMLRDVQIQQALAQGILKGIQRFLATPQASAP
jgi:N-acetylmuramoyl-L-alanine amidase